jgi:hypothetical protein
MVKKNSESATPFMVQEGQLYFTTNLFAAYHLDVSNFKMKK